MIRVLDSAGSTLVEWGRQQQKHMSDKCRRHYNNSSRRNMIMITVINVVAIMIIIVVESWQ